ncbi:lanthionine synthetase LanC family protein [Jatrophihabitans sp. YIM 134969]
MPDVAERARQAASSAFGWIAATAVDVGDGTRAWAEVGEIDDSLYSGSVGVLLACAEAVASGVTGAGLDRTASLAVERVSRLARTGAAEKVDDDGLFTGWAGVGVSLRVWATTTGDAATGAAADTVLERVAARASLPPVSGYTDIISGDAGLLVGLLTAGTASATRAAAGVVADRLIATAEDTPEGPQWRMVPDYSILMPNFSHGTAGVAYALAVAGDRLDRPDLLDVARLGAETLLRLGDQPDGWALPMTIPRQQHRPAVSFGWCHGPTGTLRLFDLLDRLHPADPRWGQTVARCYDAVRGSGLPERRTPGFWDNVARCCGTAGVGTMVLDRYRATGDPDLLAWADDLATDVLDRAIVDPTGTRWSNHEHTAHPPDLDPEAGFMQGAAGIAGWLARLAAAHDDPHSPGPDLGVVPRWL